MKRDHKPFVVEVKRGTRRSSFIGALDSATTMSEAQRRAEQALFAPVLPEPAAKAAAAEPSRRILPSLIEPPPPVLEEIDPAAERRPRPVGRPRKLKPSPEVAYHAVEAAFLPRFAEPEPVEDPVAVDEAAAWAPPLDDDRDEAVVPTPYLSDAADQPAQNGTRQRLRDRSSIMARYVLGTEPRPGERWNRPLRRFEKRSRTSD